MYTVTTRTVTAWQSGHPQIGATTYLPSASASASASTRRRSTEGNNLTMVLADKSPQQGLGCSPVVGAYTVGLWGPASAPPLTISPLNSRSSNRPWLFPHRPHPHTHAYPPTRHWVPSCPTPPHAPGPGASAATTSPGHTPVRLRPSKTRVRSHPLQLIILSSDLAFCLAT